MSLESASLLRNMFLSRKIRRWRYATVGWLVGVVLVGTWMPTPAGATDDDGRKAMEEILDISRNWTVEETRGTIQYKLNLTLNGNTEGILGELAGEGTVQVKDKQVRITMTAQLTQGRYTYVTRYPALIFTFTGRIRSSDPSVFPVKETISQQETLLLKDGRLCPLSVRQNPTCMQPVK